MNDKEAPESSREGAREPITPWVLRYAQTITPTAPITEPLLTKARALVPDLPRQIEDLYRECGNGEFYPGLRPLLFPGDPEESHEYSWEEYSAAVAYTDLHGDAENPWPTGLLRIMNWGCAIESCVDLKDPLLRVVRFDPNEFDPNLEMAEEELPTPPAYLHDVVGREWVPAFLTEAPSLEAWFDLWADRPAASDMQSLVPQRRAFFSPR